ncbi:hypothetical protein SAMN02949497_3511 [Methylomagnum ishizawai]|uniref:Phage tail protein n=1 Tax=Methylomagnum ishizawai TaxID=1760988 RepID=A0A1Y6D0H0_9GAMM|nr:hypothetical protein [Methylomagnum ishizawai]SMF96127.1 hypothetical protein SAMN02949497_3511 [Methylomagnum ishizawai]
MTLNDGATEILLPDALVWTDELAWTAVAAQDARALGGAVVRQTSVKIAGRPITLAPPDGFWGAMLRADLLALRAWTDDPAKRMTLTFADGDAYAVRWLYPDPIKANPLTGFSARAADEVWLPTLKFITVET